jgi:hypothetical protein
LSRLLSARAASCWHSSAFLRYLSALRSMSFHRGYTPSVAHHFGGAGGLRPFAARPRSAHWMGEIAGVQNCFLVGCRVRDLLLSAKHLLVAARTTAVVRRLTSPLGRCFTTAWRRRRFDHAWSFFARVPTTPATPLRAPFGAPCSTRSIRRRLSPRSPDQRRPRSRLSSSV